MISFSRDMSLRWAYKTGDYVLWAKFQGVISPFGGVYKVWDMWQLHDGECVSITNRLADPPGWFHLHPLEDSRSIAGWMKKWPDERHNPEESLEGPDLWRVLAGDRIVWVGPNRPIFTLTTVF
jgi:hypothetical protein